MHRAAAPIEVARALADARNELAPFQTCGFVGPPRCEDVGDIKPCLEPGEPPAGFGKYGVRPDLSPKTRVSPVHNASFDCE